MTDPTIIRYHNGSADGLTRAVPDWPEDHDPLDLMVEDDSGTPSEIYVRMDGYAPRRSRLRIPATGVGRQWSAARLRSHVKALGLTLTALESRPGVADYATGSSRWPKLFSLQDTPAASRNRATAS